MTADSESVTLRIQRFLPETDVRPRFQNFTVEATPHTTILDLLHAVKWAQDGSLTFRRSCRSAICGSCGLRVNGVGKLACATQAYPEIRDGAIRIEPMANARVLKDLVVDESRFFGQLEAVTPWLVPKPDAPTGLSTILPAEAARLRAAENCIFCGLCYSGCTAVAHAPSFLGPHAYAKAWRFVADPRDGARPARLAALHDTIWACTSQFHCIDECPKDVAPGDRIADLRRELLAQSTTAPKLPKQSQLAARNTAHYWASLRTYGKLNLRGYPATLHGWRGHLADLPAILKQFLSGRRLGPPVKVHGHKDVARLMAAADTAEREASRG